MGNGGDGAPDATRPPEVKGGYEGVPDGPKREPAGAPMAGATVAVAVCATDVVGDGEPVGP